MLKTIYTEFEKRLNSFGSIYVAGGAVRDSLLGKTPKDFDIFILNHNLFKDFDNAVKKINEKVQDLEEIPSVVTWHNSEPYLVKNITWKDQKIQILLNPTQSIDELISTFDWNISLFGYGKFGYIYKENIQNIGAGKELILNKSTFPLSTLRRGFRFSERFLMKLRKEDIIILCSEILKNNKQNNNIGPTGNEPDMSALVANILVN